MRRARRIAEFVEASGRGVFVTAVVLNCVHWIFVARKKKAEMERVNQMKQAVMEMETRMKQVAELEKQVETDREASMTEINI